MRILKRILSILWKSWFVLVAVIATLTIAIFIVYPLTFWKSQYKYTYKGIRLWGIVVFFLTGLRYRFQGEKLDPKQQYILVANHTSFMDIMLFLVLIKNPMVFVGKEELTKLPIFGAIYKRTSITVNRQSRDSRRDVYNQVQKRVENGCSICIFPEGGIPDDESIVLDQFKDGPFMMSITHHLPMAVHSFCGMKKCVPYDLVRGYPGVIKVYRNEIIPAGTYSKEGKNAYKDHVYKIMRAQLDACGE